MLERENISNEFVGTENLIKTIVRSIRDDKLSTEFYKNLELLSNDESMKKQFEEEFPEDRPIRL